MRYTSKTESAIHNSQPSGSRAKTAPDHQRTPVVPRSGPERIDSFRDLRVYQTAFALQQQVFELSKRFPREEQYSLTDQFRRAARSIGANLAESWQKRRYPAHFVSKLSDADSEQAETQHWIDTAFACGFLHQSQQLELMNRCQDIGRMLGRMISAPEKFCRPKS